ncbi:hypothetical protein [Rhizobium deserti]|uniref:hypothetical protein n=1 Tax=Rhizobium deserti TaxID=2547961 RepID=UPI0013869568|nr:hypothetical protein [Rhizobium deserti]
MAKAEGRNPDHLLIMPGIIPVVGETLEDAESRLAEMNGFAVHEHLIAKLSAFLGRDLSRMDLDAPLRNDSEPPKGNEASQSRAAALTGIARRNGLTLRQLLLRLASGRGHLLTVGTGTHIASVMQDWFKSAAADGFNVMCPSCRATFSPSMTW